MNREKKVVDVPVVSTPPGESNVPGGIPLQEIEYRTVIAGGVAQVRAIQRYRNDIGQPIEAVYVFPLPDEASVTGCRMVIGDRKIVAILKERELARQEYQDAIDAGHHGALMEQERPNIFTMNVGGVEPGESVEVEVDYVQRVPWQTGGGRFSIPLVVAPRFIPGNPTGKSGGGWSPDTDQVPDASRITPVVAKEGVSYTAAIKVSFSPGFRCRLTSPSHPNLISEQTVGKSATVEIVSGPLRTDRDFILSYESLAKVPQVAVHAGDFSGENFTLVSIFPPGETRQKAKNVLFLLDDSGSMSGAKIEGLKKIVKKALEKLRSENPGNRAGIIAYSKRPVIRLLIPLGPITDQMIGEISSLSGCEGTMMGQALTVAYQQLTDTDPENTIIVLVADGQSEDTAYTKGGARIVSVGIDSAINDSLLKRLARETGGTCVCFYPGEDFDRAANTVLGMVSGPVLREITVQAEGEIVGIQDVFKGMPAMIAIRHSGKIPKEIRIEGKDPAGNVVNWNAKTADSSECDFASQVWAREFIRENPNKDRQIAASLKYGVICSQTSFVAISEKEVPGQKPIRVEIPVNLPHAWDYDKVFGAGLASFHSLTGRGIGRHGLIAGRGEEMIRFGGGPVKSCFGPPIIEEIVTPPMRRRGSKTPGTRTPAAHSYFCGNGRFSLDAKDPVDRLTAILIAACSGQDGDAAKATEKLNAELTLAVVKSWSEEKRAMAFYFACRLAAFGLRIKAEVMKALSGEPNSPEAKVWYCLAERELGLQTQAAVPASASDGYDYLVWKLGQSHQPQSGDWSLVP